MAKDPAKFSVEEFSHTPQQSTQDVRRLRGACAPSTKGITRKEMEQKGLGESNSQETKTRNQTIITMLYALFGNAARGGAGFLRVRR